MRKVVTSLLTGIIPQSCFLEKKKKKTTKAVSSKALLLKLCQIFTFLYVAILGHYGPVTASAEELDKQVEAPP